MTIEISATGIILLVIYLTAPELLLLPFAILGMIWDAITGKSNK